MITSLISVFVGLCCLGVFVLVFVAILALILKLIKTM